MNASGIFGSGFQAECNKFFSCGCGKLLDDKPPASSRPMQIIITKKEAPAPPPAVKQNYNPRQPAPVEFFLHHAARRGDSAEVERLAKAGFDINSKLLYPTCCPNCAGGFIIGSLPKSLFCLKNGKFTYRHSSGTQHASYFTLWSVLHAASWLSWKFGKRIKDISLLDSNSCRDAFQPYRWHILHYAFQKYALHTHICA